MHQYMNVGVPSISWIPCRSAFKFCRKIIFHDIQHSEHPVSGSDHVVCTVLEMVQSGGPAQQEP